VLFFILQEGINMQKLKKILGTFLAMSLLFTSLTVALPAHAAQNESEEAEAATASSETPVIGDLTNDGEVNIADVIFLRR
jgi:hypothetical protein